MNESLFVTAVLLATGFFGISLGLILGIVF